jgi:hypothetical protein
MISFQYYLTEAASEDKLKHLEHAEDHVINAGFDGFAHAYHNLQDVHDQLSGKKNKTKITTKYDGSPSIVFGHHPETGKFFVASKSAFNKDPKINYTAADIEKNHGHAPGLVQKLKQALEHLPKIAPKSGVYQGDVMHSGLKTKDNPNGDVTKEGGKFHFQANPTGVKYSTKTSSEEGKKVATAKFGVAVHTMYNGKTMEDMKAEYAPDLSHFKHHPDVHNIDTQDDVQHAKMSPEQDELFKKHIKSATDAFKATPKKAYKALEGHQDLLKTYINRTVRESTTPTVAGYRSHVNEYHSKLIAKVKTAKAISAKTETLHKDLSHIDKHAENFQHILTMHHHLQNAKDQLTTALSAKPKFETSMRGKPTKPEGYVTVRDNRPTKLVDRGEFSRMHLGARTE